MIPIKLKLLLLIAVLMTGCGDILNEHYYNPEVTNDFLKHAKRPIIVKYDTVVEYDHSHNITLLAKDGSMLFIHLTNIVLPDTIK